MRSRTLWASAAAGVLGLSAIGLAVAKADNVLSFGQERPAKAETAVYRPTNTPEQDRLLAKAAFTQVLSHKAETLGMKPPLNLPAYAPVYPDGLVLTASESLNSPSGGALQYAAPGALRTVLNFYEDAAALHRMPFKVSAEGPDTLVFTASDGARQVQARLTRQFAQSTVVDVSYN